MKKHSPVLILFFLLCLSINTLWAQSDDNRNKLDMTISFGGKNIVSELSSVSTSLTRYADDSAPATVKDTLRGKDKMNDDQRSSFYLSFVVKKITPELLNLFAKRQTRFDGVINITDTYGKNPAKIIKFKDAALESYSDQFTGASYNDSYSGSNVVFRCKQLSINGVDIEL